MFLGFMDSYLIKGYSMFQKYIPFLLKYAMRYDAGTYAKYHDTWHPNENTVPNNASRMPLDMMLSSQCHVF
jgi:hypothetical protein